MGFVLIFMYIPIIRISHILPCLPFWSPSWTTIATLFDFTFFSFYLYFWYIFLWQLHFIYIHIWTLPCLSLHSPSDLFLLLHAHVHTLNTETYTCMSSNHLHTPTFSSFWIFLFAAANFPLTTDIAIIPGVLLLSAHSLIPTWLDYLSIGSSKAQCEILNFLNFPVFITLLISR